MSGKFIQIINSSGCHWVTISSVGCPKGHIQWFDSLHMQSSTDTKRVIAYIILYKGDEITVDVCNVVKQAGASDCGFFALAYATAVCHGLDPTALCFDQRKLRQHVVDCIENKFVTPFPVTREHSQRKPVLFSLAFKIYCVCRLPDDGSKMVACSKCSKWFHLQCTTITTEEELEQDWFCSKCISSRGMTHHVILCNYCV